MIDLHIHFIGNGTNGSGCQLFPPKGHRKLLLPVMLHAAGLPASALRSDLDAIYTERLLELIRGSDLTGCVLLANELPYSPDGKALPDAAWVYIPNDPVLNLAKDHPEFYAGVSIHPARPDAMDELERCIAGGASLLKLLPNCQNVDCRLPQYRPFFKRMATAGLPLLAHTGGELTLPVVDAALSDPATLIGALDCGVTVIGAHCGTRSGLWDPDYFEQFCRMLREHPNFYGDISALNHPVRSHAYRQLLKREDLHPKLVNGSDFPVPVQAWPIIARGLISWQDYRRCTSIKNPLQRDIALKRAIGVPDRIFHQGAALLRKPD